MYDKQHLCLNLRLARSYRAEIKSAATARSALAAANQEFYSQNSSLWLAALIVSELLFHLCWGFVVIYSLFVVLSLLMIFHQICCISRDYCGRDDILTADISVIFPNRGAAAEKDLHTLRLLSLLRKSASPKAKRRNVCIKKHS